MARNSSLRVFGIIIVVALLIVGFAVVRSCHSVEDPQHFEDDDVTQVDAPTPTPLAAAR